MAASKLYTLLHHHLDHGHYPAALKVTAKLLAADPTDHLALRTRAQLLVALDRYHDALAHPAADALARAYCLYKLARTDEAQQALNTARDSGDDIDDRAADVLQAQLHYRLGEYDSARDLFDDLASTAEPDSPELPDLQANSAASSAHLEFASAVPSTLASLAEGALLPSTDELEARPLALVLPATSSAAGPSRAPAHAPVASTSSAAPTPAPTKPKTRRALPKSFDAARPASALPDDRWVPKRERPSMRDALLQAKEKARGKKRERVMREQGMQGAADPPSAQGGGAKAGGGGTKAAGKKKKGKK
ncbi:hypothetical protein JCM10450v2_000113 [Rhodotorula kratochvilovae]